MVGILGWVAGVGVGEAQAQWCVWGGVSWAGLLTELSIPRARSMMKNTIAQNVDPDRVEMASGYRMKTRPAPARNTKNLTNGWDCLSDRWQHSEAQSALAQAHDSWSVMCSRANQGSEDAASSSLQFIAHQGG